MNQRTRGFRSEQMKDYARARDLDKIYGRDLTNDIIAGEVAADRRVYDDMKKAGIKLDFETKQAQSFNNYAAHRPEWAIQQTRQYDEPLNMNLVSRDELARAKKEYDARHFRRF